MIVLLTIPLIVACSDVLILDGAKAVDGSPHVWMGYADEDTTLAITRFLHPLLAIGICWAARTAAFKEYLCLSVCELKLVLAIERCACLRDRVALVNLALWNNMCCRVYYGPILQPHAKGVVYGPSQLATIDGHTGGSYIFGPSVHVVPFEMSVNLSLYRSDEFTGVRLNSIKLRRHDVGGDILQFLVRRGNAGLRRSHWGDHASDPQYDIVADTLCISEWGQEGPVPKDPYWQRQTFVTIEHVDCSPGPLFSDSIANSGWF